MNLTDFLRPLSRFALAAGVASAVGFAAPAAFAQAPALDGVGVEADARVHGRHRHGGRGRMHVRMANELELSDAQRARIRAIMTEARASRADGQAARGGHARVRAQIQAVLTPEQRQRAHELRQERERAMLDRRVARLSARLELTATQAQQIRGILGDAAMQRRALAEQASDGPGSAREAMQGLRARTQVSIRSVLSAEQATELDAMRARRGERDGRRHGRGHGPRGR